MKIGILNELNDTRIAIVPSKLAAIKELGGELLMEKGSGDQSFYFDDQYQEHVSFHSREEILSNAQIIPTIHPLPENEWDKIAKEAILISMFQPYNDKEIVGKLQDKKLRAFSLDMIPRTTLAQSMDVLSSMASIAGYQAVLAAANQLPRYFPMMITAAGSVRPATVLVLGAGVAGLQAIATAKRLGAVVQAFDTRAAAKEEVESLGGKFIEVEGAKDDTSAGGYAVEQSEEFIKRQQAEVQNRAMKADVIITTAQVRGRKAPLLVPKSTVDKMKPGSVIVDLASSTGGNCEVTKDNEMITYNNVFIIGNSHLASSMPQDASTLFCSNLINFLKLLVKDGELTLDLENEIIASSFITHEQEEVS